MSKKDKKKSSAMPEPEKDEHDPAVSAEEQAIADEIKDLEEIDSAANAQNAADDFDYVVPNTTYKNRHKKLRKHKKKTKSGSVQTEEKDPVDEAMDGYVFATPVKKHKKHGKHKSHKKKMPLWLKIVIIVVSIILVLVIAFGAAFYIMREIGRKEMHNYDDIAISIPLQDDDGKDSADILDNGRNIRYNGKTYCLNEDVMSVVFIGYNENESGTSNNYMADAIYIVAIDDYTGKSTIIGVSRDTMLDVDVYSAAGDYIETNQTQLSYAYSYGNDKVSGGDNVDTSLTRLFFGLPFNNYFAINLAALEDLNEAIGGVTLTSMLTFESETYGRTIQEGEQVTLHGKDVDRYIQTRDQEAIDANNARMDHQQQYIKAFLSSIVPAAKKDLSTVTSLFDVVSGNSDTTLDLPKVTYLASTALSKMRDASEIEYLRLEGKIKKGKNAEMYLKDKDVLETMLKVFYTPVE